LYKIKKYLPTFWLLLIAGACVVWISLLFPQSGRFRYEFQKGYVWSYQDLLAPFDFAILKSSEEIEADKERAKNEVVPYYRINTVNGENAKLRAKSDLKQWLKNQQSIDTSDLILWELNIVLENKIDELSETPIGELREEDQQTQEINIVKGNSVKTIPAERVVSVDQMRNNINQWSPEAPEEYRAAIRDIISNYVTSNLSFDQELTQQAFNESLNQVVDREGLIRKGDLIIPQGAVVTDEHYKVLSSLKRQYEREVLEEHSHFWRFLGFLLLTLLIIGVYLLYLWNHHKKLLKNPIKLSFLFMWFFVFSYLVYIIEGQTNLSSYILPFCIVPIVVKNYFNERLAFFTHVVVILIASFLSNLGYEFTFLQLLAGIVTVLTVRDTRDWSEFFKTIVLILGAYILGFVGLEWIKQGGWSQVNLMVITWLSINAFLTLLAYPLIPLLERVFGFTSSITLVELSDINKPLLKELSIKAPGTFHHSLQVGNLAEDAAHQIGANGLLLKTAALYHDIGKMNNPEYFIENQSGDNPHEHESWKESASIIIKHVTEGASMAKKARLPKLLQDFILTHHGTTRVEYFYRNYLKENPDANIEEIAGDFEYPGPKPTSKEETILMIADSLEAACKSLKSPTGKEIDELVESITQHKIENNQFVNSELNFDELEKCKASFKKTLKSIHHVRLAYPKDPSKPQSSVDS
jgi:cyclic-di-AMP phosphodiesterase PgpH